MGWKEESLQLSIESLLAVSAALLAALVALYTFFRGVNQKVIIEERQAWRNSMRQLVAELLNAKTPWTRQMKHDMILLNLNPHKDQNLVEALADFLQEPSGKARQQVTYLFQVHLKLDWERSKIEARFFSKGAEWRAGRIVRRQRRSCLA